MGYTHNYRETKQQLKIVGCLFFIGGLIALLFVGIEAVGFIIIGVVFFWQYSKTKCIHWRLYNGCLYCKQLFCTDCHQNFGHLNSYLDEQGVINSEHETIFGYDNNKIISGPDKPSGCGSICSMCSDAITKKRRNRMSASEKFGRAIDDFFEN